MTSHKVDIVLQRTCRTTGEGPHWQESKNLLLYVDIEAGFVHRWNPISQEKSALHLDYMVSAIVPCKSGGYIVAVDKSLARLDWDTKQLQILHTVEDGLENRFNDAKCDASGRLWAGTMPLNNDGNAMALPRERGALYSLETDGTLKTRVTGITLSNGLAWNSANDSMYYIDSIPKKVYAFDFNLANGDMINQRTIYQLNDEGFPDGMSIDSENKLWVATFGPGQIRRLDPKNGTVLTTIEIAGARNITSCCFGGPDLTDLYVTSCTLGIKDEEQDVNKEAGSVFKVTGLGIKGCKAYEYGT